MTALALGMIGGVSMLPSNPVHVREQHAATWVFVAIVELLTAALVVVMFLGVLDWLLTGTLYATDALAPFPLAFAIAFAGVVAAAWYLSRRELVR